MDSIEKLEEQLTTESLLEKTIEMNQQYCMEIGKLECQLTNKKHYRKCNLVKMEILELDKIAWELGFSYEPFKEYLNCIKTYEDLQSQKRKFRLMYAFNNCDKDIVLRLKHKIADVEELASLIEKTYRFVSEEINVLSYSNIFNSQNRKYKTKDQKIIEIIDLLLKNAVTSRKNQSD